jgi:2-oxoglutarate dehydrogenase E2 component (dihydrolipoamide succinyltransferase)
MAIAELVMPKLGESIMEATILKWHKKVGDYVKFDETVLDIATDKVDSEVPSTEQGIITEILFQVNDVVPIGAIIARIQTNADSKTTEIPKIETAPLIGVPVFEEAPVVEETPVITNYEPTISSTPIFTEPLAEPIAQIQIPEIDPIPYTPTPISQEIAKPIGNRFYSPLVLNIANSEGISLSELERIPGTGNDGRVSKRDVLQYVQDRKTGKVPTFQQPIYTPAATIPAPVPTPVTETEPISAATPMASPIQSVVNPTISELPKVEEKVAYTKPTDYSPEVNYPDEVVNHPIIQEIPPLQPIHIPEVQKVMISHTNPIKQDTYQPSSHSGKFSDPASVTITGNTEIIEMDRMRKLIAKHMVDSKHTSPHVTSFTEADVTNMVQWREKVKLEFEKREGTKLTFTPMFVECIAAVIKHFPLVNCSIDGDNIILKKDINIGMATALPSGNLIVPVIKAADQLNIVGLSKAVNGLADAARNNRLKPEETTGGTFTLTNVGTFGSLMGTPIIPQPQVAILAVGAIKKRPMVIESPNGDTIGIRHMMYLSLSYDHRIVDGSIGASFLTAVAKAFESWDPNKQWYQYL